MKITRLAIVFLMLGMSCTRAAQQIDLPICNSGDGKTPVPRWEVNASPVLTGNNGRVFLDRYSVPYPPPVAHGVLAHMRVKLEGLDQASCSALIERLKETSRDTGQTGPIVVQWKADDRGAPDDVRSLDFYEVPAVVKDECWLDGVFQFVALGHSDDSEPEEFLVNMVPIEALQREGSFCRPIQEG